MAENPASSAILALRRDLNNITAQIDNGGTIDTYAGQANAQVKRDLRDVHDIKWSQVYDSDNEIYFVDTDGEANNDDRIKNMIALLCISYVFRDYSIAVAENAWFELHLHYMEQYQSAMNQARLDVDLDDSGEISEDEERQTTQSFMVR